MALKKYWFLGCVIVFDELVNYPEFENHEMKAFYEWITNHSIQFEWIGMNGKMLSREQIQDTVSTCSVEGIKQEETLHILQRIKKT